MGIFKALLDAYVDSAKEQRMSDPVYRQKMKIESLKREKSLLIAEGQRLKEKHENGELTDEEEANYSNDCQNRASCLSKLNEEIKEANRIYNMMRAR